MTIKAMIQGNAFVEIHRRLRKNRSRRVLSSIALRKVILRSKEEIKNDLLTLSKKPTLEGSIKLTKDVVGASVSVSNFGLSHLSSLFDFSLESRDELKIPSNRVLLEAVAKGKKIHHLPLGHSHLFKLIYKQQIYQHQNPHEKEFFPLPKINVTIALVAGVFNELFQDAAFQRGVEHLSKKIGVKFVVPKVSGAKGSHHNAKLIEEQLADYICQNPQEKLWIIAFSKGGLDSLHYLVSNRDFATAHILGLTTIASPIMGTSHLDKRLIQVIRHLSTLPAKKVRMFIKEKGNIFSPDFQDSLNSSYRQSWFKRNYRFLPQELFYTAIALRSNWSESHVWMRLTKILLHTDEVNDGIVESRFAMFPKYFKGINLGILHGHHLVGARSSTYSQEALVEALVIFLLNQGLLPRCD